MKDRSAARRNATGGRWIATSPFPPRPPSPRGNPSALLALADQRLAECEQQHGNGTAHDAHQGVDDSGGDEREYGTAFGERVALTAAAKQDIIDSIERVYSRAPLEDRDARAWHLMARALGSTVTPKDLGLDVSRRRGRRLDALSQALQPPEGTDRIQTRPTNEP